MGRVVKGDGTMTEQEYRRRRAEIVARYMEEIDDHVSAGCYGDAETARKWMRRELDALDEERGR